MALAAGSAPQNQCNDVFPRHGFVAALVLIFGGSNGALWPFWMRREGVSAVCLIVLPHLRVAIGDGCSRDVIWEERWVLCIAFRDREYTIEVSLIGAIELHFCRGRQGGI